MITSIVMTEIFVSIRLQPADLSTQLPHSAELPTDIHTAEGHKYWEKKLFSSYSSLRQLLIISSTLWGKFDSYRTSLSLLNVLIFTARTGQYLSVLMSILGGLGWNKLINNFKCEYKVMTRTVLCWKNQYTVGVWKVWIFCAPYRPLLVTEIPLTQ